MTTVPAAGASRPMITRILERVAHSLESTKEARITDQPRRPHRPARYADLTAMIDAHGGHPQPLPGEVAASTASTVLAAGRDADGEVDVELAPLVELADIVGIETLAALWRSAEPSSLAGSLWAMYLLRQWCGTAAREVSALWRGGQRVAAADAVVAGVGMHGDEDAVRAFADAVLIGAFRGDFDVALERAAAFFRVVAAGRRRAVTDGDSSSDEIEVAQRNERAARALSVAAGNWRAGTLV